MLEQTLMLIKPDGVLAGQIGEVIRRVEAAGFRICGIKMLRLRPETAGEFYGVHRDKPFFDDLLDFMTSERIVALVLEREDAVSCLREIIGTTDPAEAAEGTIRKELASNKQENVVHASDSLSTAEREISFFFSREELL
ncbi:MAG: nucleoside-diphosphate kinase [bacterium]